MIGNIFAAQVWSLCNCARSAFLPLIANGSTSVASMLTSTCNWKGSKDVNPKVMPAARAAVMTQIRAKAKFMYHSAVPAGIRTSLTPARKLRPVSQASSFGKKSSVRLMIMHRTASGEKKSIAAASDLVTLPAPRFIVSNVPVTGDRIGPGPATATGAEVAWVRDEIGRATSCAHSSQRQVLGSAVVATAAGAAATRTVRQHTS
mmetsp:Transcript_69348/g.200901  ORF Transcript_69348/g.200901 Transcript_69348/m.200901 type:complete len:204 (-) Transcript_69348:7-618(-)